jgi:hypothetical protein
MDSEYLAALQAGFEDELSKIAASAEERLREAQQEGAGLAGDWAAQKAQSLGK